MSSYGKYPKVVKSGKLVEQRAKPETDFTGDPGFTVQADRDDADINKIIARFQKSGQLPPTLNGEPFYGDVSAFDGLAGCLIAIQEADKLFMSYPAEVRERFDNDRVKFIEFLENPGNREEAVSLGLIQEPVPDVAPSALEAPGSGS